MNPTARVPESGVATRSSWNYPSPVFNPEKITAESRTLVEAPGGHVADNAGGEPITPMAGAPDVDMKDQIGIH